MFEEREATKITNRRIASKLHQVRNMTFDVVVANSHLTHNIYTSHLYCTQRHSYCMNFCYTIFTRILIVHITSPHSHNGTFFDHAVYHALLLYIMFLKLPPTP